MTAGLGTWLFGRLGIHIGGSGVIFGYFGFLLLHGLLEKAVLSVCLSLFVGVFYWRWLFSLLPTAFWVSWELHLFGFLGGILAAQWAIASTAGSSLN